MGRTEQLVAGVLEEVLELLVGDRLIVRKDFVQELLQVPVFGLRWGVLVLG